jgi:3-hydroxyacyl-[acyl-carrier-protein] dehydratase
VSALERKDVQWGPDRIAELLPHRPPMVFVDRISAYSGPGPALWASKTVATDDPVFAAHFPGRPVWPGAFTVEGLAQCCAAVLALEGPGGGGGHPLLAAVQVKLTREIRPGERIDYRVELTHRLGDLCRFEVEAQVGSQPAASGHLTVGRAVG